MSGNLMIFSGSGGCVKAEGSFEIALFLSKRVPFQIFVPALKFLKNALIKAYHHCRVLHCTVASGSWRVVHGPQC